MRLLLVEDDATLADEVARRLRADRYAVDVSRNGEDALHQASEGPYAAVILDLGLPVLDGVTILSRLRASGAKVPVLVLTARDRLADKAAAFRAGADDYLTKPFRIEELLLRLDALIRRAGGHASPHIAIGDVSIDTLTGSVEREGLSVRLTALETRILLYLAHRPRQTVSRAELTEHVYDHDHDRDFNSLEVIISRLRKKLGDDLIQTIRGAGYRMNATPPP
ncbi:response regulator transcription factor [Phreatobacter sp. AB_2022a]|uniref:response regulator transcription factor n=1 Tax=Phreatobacter sp. AB_2022a TaxID=3003134 RepID=UPI0022875981|nr:response regulator transcription factor [Phreatobacter sp. AB_2022a]MCZ0736934.1 response regulator transcription factor [Phreatobacter sp. AB_2022a]